MVHTYTLHLMTSGKDMIGILYENKTSVMVYLNCMNACQVTLFCEDVKYYYARELDLTITIGLLSISWDMGLHVYIAQVRF